MKWFKLRVRWYGSGFVVFELCVFDLFCICLGLVLIIVFVVVVVLVFFLYIYVFLM